MSLYYKNLIYRCQIVRLAALTKGEDTGSRSGLDQRLANLVDLPFEFGRRLAEAMIIPGTT